MNIVFIIRVSVGELRKKGRKERRKERKERKERKGKERKEKKKEKKKERKKGKKKKKDCLVEYNKYRITRVHDGMIRLTILLYFGRSVG